MTQRPAGSGFPQPNGEDYRALIESSRVSGATRDALADHDRHDDPCYVPQALDAAGLHTLRALIARVIPSSLPQHVDLAARMDQRLARGVGDGWRLAGLPADPVAYRRGLCTLDHDSRSRFGVIFAELSAPQQDALLAGAAAGDGDGDSDGVGDDGRGAEVARHATPSEFPVQRLTRAQLRDWFEDVRADAVRQYVAHPLTLARIGYSGIANGGDGLPKSGFVCVGLGEREDWEPLPSSAARS